MNFIKNNNNKIYSGIKIFLFMTFYITFSLVSYGLINRLPVYNHYLLNLLLKTASVIFLIIAFAFVYLVEHRKPHHFGIVLSKKSCKHLLIGLVLGALSIIIIALILFITNNAVLTHGLHRPMFSIDIFYILLLFIMVGIDEELLVRGYIVHTLARYNAKYVVYLVPAIIFSALHLSNPNVSIMGLINIVIVGILFTYMTLKTKNILMAIGYHITWNFFQGGFFGFNVSGATTEAIYPVTVISDNLLTGGDFGLEGGILTTLIIVVGVVVVHKLPKDN